VSGEETVAGGPDARAAAIVDLGERLGPGRVEAGEGLWRFAAAGRTPRCVVRPERTDQIGETVEVARRSDLGIIPCGGGTSLDIGFPPRRYDVALCLGGLDRIIAHDAEDMTVTVEPGVTLGALDEALGRAGQWLPLDPARADQVTVGGLIAADRSGPLRLAHGKVRDLLIGLRVVTAGGEIVRGGGRVVKNVAGYDLPKLLAGSFGTLGVIVEATFKVRPRPAERRLFVLPLRSIADAVDQAMRLADSPLCPESLEAVNESAAEATGVASGAALVVGLAGSAAETAAGEALLAEQAGREMEACEPERAAAVRRALRDFPAPASEDAIVARIAILPGNLASLLRRIEWEAAARRIVVEIAAHAGSGVAWCQGFEATDPRALPLFAEWIRVTTRELDGWVVFEALPEALRQRVDPWGFSEPSVRLMKAVKEALDPGGLFSPGRFVGGI
jgi:glycolate oxidase FAD binding subunit